MSSANLRGNRFGIQPDPSEALSVINSIAIVNELSAPTPSNYTVNSPGQIQKVRTYGGVKSILRSLKFGWPKIFRSQCGADVVRVKNNLIAFYEQDGKIIKIFHEKNSLKRHLEGIDDFHSCTPSSFTFPCVLHSATHPVPYTVETLISGTKLAKPTVFSLTNILDLVTFHFRRTEFLERSFSGSDQKILENTLKGMSLTYETQNLINQVFRGSSHLVPYGQIHGDLHVGNIMQGNGTRVILDWELYGRGYISDDVLSIWLESDDETRNRIIDVYDAAQYAEDSAVHESTIEPASFGLQLFISLMNRTIKLNTKTYDYLLNRDGVPSKADKSLKKVENNLLRGLNTLSYYI